MIAKPDDDREPKEVSAGALQEIRTAMRAGDFDAALAGIANIPQGANEDPELHILRVDALLKSGHQAKAAEALSLAVAAERTTGDQVVRLAGMANSLRRPDLERAALMQATRAGHQTAALLSRLVVLHRAAGDIAAASNLAGQLAAANPDDEAKFLAWTSCLAAEGRHEEAVRQITARIEDKGVTDATLLAWGQAVTDGSQRPEDVIAKLPDLDRGRSAPWVAPFLRGHALAALDCSAEALAELRSAAGLAPHRADIRHELAVLQRRMGLTEESQASFRAVLERQPGDVATLRLMGYEHVYQAGDFNFALVQQALAHENDFARAGKVDIHYAAAKAYEDLGDVDAAFRHYSTAGALQKEITPWSDEGVLRLARAFKRLLTPQIYSGLCQHGFESDVPVFVIGMPRSGTTLVEQILASHPDVYGAGELKLAEGALNGVHIGATVFETTKLAGPAVVARDSAITWAGRGRKYVEGLSAGAPPGARRIIDKMPGNYQWAGLISAMLPQSRFIHCRRHPIDCCLSQFKLHFGAEVPYSYDLADLGKAYRAYHALMQLWSELLPPSRMIHVRYEDVAGDVEASARRLIGFLGLPWNEACLAFHRNARPVRTASAAQVRRPVYTGSIGAWRRYEKHLRPLLDEIGDLAEAYERELEEAAGGPPDGERP